MKGSIILEGSWLQTPFGVSTAPGVPATGRRRLRRGKQHPEWLPASAVGLLIALWTVAILFTPEARLVLFSSRAQAGLDSASALVSLFGALVLLLFPAVEDERRLRWVASGLLVLGLGGLIFGSLEPLFSINPSLNTSVYASLTVRGFGCALFAAGLVPRTAPKLSLRSAIVGAAVLCLGGVMVATVSNRLPLLIHGTNLQAVVAQRPSILPGLSGWHWGLSSLSLGVAVASLAGAAARLRGGALRNWLLVAMVLLAASQLHSVLWPSTYTPVVTTANVLRLIFATVVAAGGTLELRRVATERTTLLAAEQERSRRLTEVNVLKADFTAMVAHELSSPLAAIRGYADMLATGELGSATWARAVSAIQTEAGLLTNLVADVQEASTVERHDFAVEARPVPVRDLLTYAMAFARTLPSAHPLIAPIMTAKMVWADPERIGQVLRNLLSNAAKYSPEGGPIEIRLLERGRRVRIEVADQGYGIHPNDMNRIFEKFGRGRDQNGQRVRGVGLGLYLSRRIVQAHGSDLSGTSTWGEGSTFGFELEVVL
jgi:signal transduction histidine kinase